MGPWDMNKKQPDCQFGVLSLIPPPNQEARESLETHKTNSQLGLQLEVSRPRMLARDLLKLVHIL